MAKAVLDEVGHPEGPQLVCHRIDNVLEEIELEASTKIRRLHTQLMGRHDRILEKIHGCSAGFSY